MKIKTGKVNDWKHISSMPSNKKVLIFLIHSDNDYFITSGIYKHKNGNAFFEVDNIIENTKAKPIYWMDIPELPNSYNTLVKSKEESIFITGPFGCKLYPREFPLLCK